jgi:hypothetical protein
MAITTHEGLAAEATAYLGKSASANEGLSGSQKEIRRQADYLVEWALSRGVLLTVAYIADLKRHPGETSEHVVFYRETDNRAVKSTYPGSFGFAIGPNGKTRSATPLYYLRRLELMNREFDADLRLEGIVLGRPRFGIEDGDRPSIVVSQGWIEAIDANSPHPSEQEISDYMAKLGFARLEYSTTKWRRESDGIMVFDTKVDNFINSPAGPVPIDLLVGEA